MNEIILHKLPIPAKILATMFLLTLSLGYCYAILNLFLSTQMFDGQKGLSIKDIKLKYYGDRSNTILEQKINTTMRVYLPTDEAKKKIKDWISSGVGYDRYEKDIKPVFEKNCVQCHSPEGERYNSPLTNYEEALKFTEIDKGKPYERLAESSHIHIISMGMMFFLVGVIFLFTSFPKWSKIVIFIASFGSIIMDIGSWWLTKMVEPFFAYFVFLGGILMGLSFALQVLGCLYKIWFNFGNN